MTAGKRRPLWRSPLFWSAAGIAAHHAVGAWNLRASLKHLAPPATAVAAPPASIRVHMIVPMLREQPHAVDALRFFAGLLDVLPGSTLTMVTTTRERQERVHLAARLGRARRITAQRFPQLHEPEIAALTAAQATAAGGVLSQELAADVLARFPSTSDVVDRAIADLRLGSQAVRHVVYDGNGRKAAQVNHAVAALPAVNAHDYIAVYDVDSRPDPALMLRTAAHAVDRRGVDGTLPPIVQQSAAFTVSGIAASGLDRYLARGAARLQTLWTLRREIPSFRRSAAAASRPTGVAMVDAVRRGLVQTVGHGLWVRHDIYQLLGGLPEHSVLDDLPFGFRVTVEGIPVEVVPMLAQAPYAETVGELVGMHRRWYGNYLDYPGCAAQARAGGHGSPIGRAVALSVAGYRGTVWAAAGPATVATVAALLAPGGRWPTRLLAGVGLWLGCVTPVRMQAAADGRPLAASETARDAAELLAGYLVWSAGPLTALATTAGRRVRPFSPRTHRRSAQTPGEVR